MTDNTLKFNNVAYIYESSGFTLRVSDLSLKTDVITFITGLNGSGKTTFAKLSAGILKPRWGEILIAGMPLSSLSLGEIGKRVGYLWQNPRQQLFARSVLEELTFVDELKNPKMKPDKKIEINETALNWLEYFGLSHLKDKSCFYLSQGEKQRLALAAVIASGAKYLVLDEPTKGLDPKRKKALTDLLLKLRHEAGTGMAIISHDESFSAELQERVVKLHKGEIVYG